jgi:hypothetical protein
LKLLSKANAGKLHLIAEAISPATVYKVNAPLYQEAQKRSRQQLI